MTKPLEYYLALLAGIAFVFMQHREKPWPARVIISGISGAIGYSVAPEIASYFGRCEMLAVLICSALSYAVLDTAFGIVKDRATISEIVRARLGGSRK